MRSRPRDPDSSRALKARDHGPRALEIKAEKLDANFRRTDRIFATLLVCQWLVGTVLALVVSPRSWAGAQSPTHLHVWAAVLLGGAFAAYPIAMALLRPGTRLSRVSIAIGQTLTASLWIHLTGGRIETHFFIFVSLAFLYFYRDVQVLLWAAALVAVDHILRGIYWPQSIYGVLSGAEWRWVEHAAWVAFEVVVLSVSIRRWHVEMLADATRQAQTETFNHVLEAQNEELKKARDALSASNHELESFASIAAHDLAEPLRKVRAYSERITARYREQLDERGIGYIDKMQKATGRMQTLIEDILTLSRVATRAQPFTSVDLGALVGEVLADLEVRIKDSGAQVEVGALPQIHGDQRQLRQLVQNLLANALKFQREGVPPEISVAVVDDPAIGAERTHIRVRDNGIGLEPKYADRIFKAFQRLHSRQEYEGTGIGLAICDKIVRRHGGKIWVESTPGEGSSFHFLLPLCPEALERERQETVSTGTPG